MAAFSANEQGERLRHKNERPDESTTPSAFLGDGHEDPNRSAASTLHGSGMTTAAPQASECVTDKAPIVILGSVSIRDVLVGGTGATLL